MGTEVGAAAKNVIGIAAGMLDGKGLSSLKGLADGAGRAGDCAAHPAPWAETSFPHTGCGHLGDYEATLFSSHSHNRQFGESYIKGEPYGSLAEGVPTGARPGGTGGALWSGTSYL